jgi:hypothetical protein
VGIRLLFDPTSHLQKSKIALKLIDLLNHLPAELIQFSGLDSLVLISPASS